MNRQTIDGAQIDAEARNLIRSLCPIAGNPDAVRDALTALIHGSTPERLLVLALTTLHVTYSECLDAPVPLDEEVAA